MSSADELCRACLRRYDAPNVRCSRTVGTPHGITAKDPGWTWCEVYGAQPPADDEAGDTNA